MIKLYYILLILLLTGCASHGYLFEPNEDGELVCVKAWTIEGTQATKWGEFETDTKQPSILEGLINVPDAKVVK